MQSAVQILHALHNILDLILVLGLNLARLANGHVEGNADSTLAVGQPAGCRDLGVGHEADTVLAGVSGGEGEAAGVVLALVYDAVVIVEGLFHGDLDLEVVVDGEDAGVGVDDLGVELACSLKVKILVNLSDCSEDIEKKRNGLSYRLLGCP